MEAFESLKNRINIELSAAEYDLMNGEQLIKKHCDHLRNQHEQQQQQQINEFETETLNVFSSLSKEKLLNKLAEIRSLVANLDMSQPERANSELSHQLARLAVERENIQAFVFNGKLLESRNKSLELRSFYSIEFSHLNK